MEAQVVANKVARAAAAELVMVACLVQSAAPQEAWTACPLTACNSG